MNDKRFMFPSRRQRTLSEEEASLWQQTMRNVEPLSQPKPAVSPDNKETRPPQITPLPQKKRLLPAPQKQQHSTKPHTKLPPVTIDRKVYRELSRGKRSPEASLDLHGLTLAQAEPALNRFIHRSYGSGLRLILVITGKGTGGSAEGPLPFRRGALRYNLPNWLERPVISCMIQQCLPAHRHHGGDGAFYIYLRRRK